MWMLEKRIKTLYETANSIALYKIPFENRGENTFHLPNMYILG